jgi:hypothetical protein
MDTFLTNKNGELKMLKSLDELSYAVLPNGQVRVEKLSPLTGTPNAMDLPMTADQLITFCEDGGKTLLQNLLPVLTPDQREFLKTGYTPADWLQIFPPSSKE